MRLGFVRVLGFSFRTRWCRCAPPAPTSTPMKARVRAFADVSEMYFSKTSGIDLSIPHNANKRMREQRSAT